MRLVLAITLGLVVQVILYALGAKPFDAFLAFITILTLAASYEILVKYLPGNKD
jgi:hypothetical protein